MLFAVLLETIMFTHSVCSVRSARSVRGFTALDMFAVFAAFVVLDMFAVLVVFAAFAMFVVFFVMVTRVLFHVFRDVVFRHTVIDNITTYSVTNISHILVRFQRLSEVKRDLIRNDFELCRVTRYCLLDKVAGRHLLSKNLLNSLILDMNNNPNLSRQAKRLPPCLCFQRCHER